MLCQEVLHIEYVEGVDITFYVILFKMNNFTNEIITTNTH